MYFVGKLDLKESQIVRLFIKMKYTREYNYLSLVFGFWNSPRRWGIFWLHVKRRILVWPSVLIGNALDIHKHINWSGVQKQLIQAITQITILSLRKVRNNTIFKNLHISPKNIAENLKSLASFVLCYDQRTF